MPIPEYGSVLCHYTKASTAFEHILTDRQLRFSPYSRMRDPTEANDWRFRAAYHPANLGLHANRSLLRQKNSYLIAEEAMNEIKQHAKLVAFTVDAPNYDRSKPKSALFGRGWARARMWEHYGENHRGACLVFDQAALHEDLRSGILDAGAESFYYGPVHYTEAGLAGASGALDFPCDVSKAEQEITDHLARHYRDLFLLKTLDWASEHEYRYVAHTPDDDDYLFVPFSDSLRAVIVGEDLPPWQAAGVLELCRRIGAEAYRLEWLPGGPWPMKLKPRASGAAMPLEEAVDRAGREEANGPPST